MTNCRTQSVRGNQRGHKIKGVDTKYWFMSIIEHVIVQEVCKPSINMNKH